MYLKSLSAFKLEINRGIAKLVPAWEKNYPEYGSI